MQMALEALDLLAKWENPCTKWQVRKPKDGGPIVTIYPHKVATDAAIALRQALETKREWVGLTDDEIQDLSYLSQKIDEGNAAWFDRWGFARAIETRLQEKNQ
jgi:hypothetical protein